MTELTVIKDPALLNVIIEKARDNPKLYIALNFLSNTGLLLKEVLNIQACECTGDSYFSKKTNHLFIFGKAFSNYLHNYIDEHNLYEGYLLPRHYKCIYEPYCQPTLSKFISDHLAECGYKGGSRTFANSYLYNQAYNCGAIDAEATAGRAYDKKWVESKLDMAHEEYLSLKDNIPIPDDITDITLEAANICLKEIKAYIDNPNNEEDSKQALRLKVFELYRLLYKGSSDKTINLLNS